MGYPNSLCSELELDDVVLSDFDQSAEELQHLINIDCALALSVCKTRHLPSCVFVLSLLYMKRLRALHSSASSPLIEIDQLTTKELYLVAALLADKYLIDEGEDEQLFNSELGELTGIRCERINYIERQVLTALNWNLHVSNEEFAEFFSLFQRQMSKKFDSTSDADESSQFYHLCLNFLPSLIEYLALTSFVLLGSTISILAAVHLGTLTHSTLMNTFHPSVNCSSWIDHRKVNTSFEEPTSIYPLDQSNWKFPTDFSNDTANDHTWKQLSIKPFQPLSCSMDLLSPNLISRSAIATFV